MRKKYSIGFLVLAITIVCLLVVIYRLSYHKAILQLEEELLEKTIDLDKHYFIKDTDGYVTVYMADKETVYEFTSIPTNQLPSDVQKKLKSGIKADTMREVYGFLENYSS